MSMRPAPEKYVLVRIVFIREVCGYYAGVEKCAR
jgi:hypothetical protein